MTSQPDENMLVTDPDTVIPQELSDEQRVVLLLEKYYQYAERQDIRRAIGDLIGHTSRYQGMSLRAMENNVDAIIIVADALGKTTSELLKEHLVFRLETGTGKGNVAANGWFDREIR